LPRIARLSTPLTILIYSRAGGLERRNLTPKET